MNEYTILFNNLIFTIRLKLIKKRANNPFVAPSTNLAFSTLANASEPLVSVRKHIEKRAKDAGNKTRTYKEDEDREEREKEGRNISRP